MKINHNILLVIPKYWQYGGKQYVMPLGILYVSAAAKAAGLPVYTLNLNHTERDPEIALLECISANDISILGSGGLSGEFDDLFNLFKTVKKHAPHVTTIAGGGIISASPRSAMVALEYVDYGIIGEGEEVFVNLIRALQYNESVENVRGLIIKKEGSFIKTASADCIGNIDILPFPDYDGFDYGTYLRTNSGGYGPHGEILTPVSIIGSRSCPYKCTFCFHPTGSKYRERSLNEIFNEIEYLLSKYPINYIALREEIFSTEQDRIEQFCIRMKEYGVLWSLQLRIDSVSDTIFKTLQNSKCFYIYLGIESLNNTVLKSMRKNITSLDIHKSLLLAEKYNIMVRSGLIFGDKAETKESYKTSLDWLEKNYSYSELYKRPAIIADMLIPFPGTELFNYACNHGIIKNKAHYIKSGCPVVNITKMSDYDFVEMMLKVKVFSKKSFNFYTNGSIVVV